MRGVEAYIARLEADRAQQAAGIRGDQLEIGLYGGPR